ncbi:MAG: sulfurtransferase [Pseudomonadota bacterium]
MAYTNLVSPGVLAQHLGAADWRVVDCRFSLADPAAGHQLWRDGHIPGAVYANLDRHLASAVEPGSGRHPLPSPRAFAKRLGAWGITRDTQVVAYDDAGGAFAARLWWLLRWVGHEAAAVLDGGLPAWLRAGHALSDELPEPEATTYDAQPRPELAIERRQLRAMLTAGTGVLLDARDAERFMGEREPLDTRAGHIPGARNYPFPANLDDDGVFLKPAQLRACFGAALQDAEPQSVVMMCGSGVTACHNLLAMDVAGLPGARLYPGSWSEWIADPSRPVASGPA